MGKPITSEVVSDNKATSVVESAHEKLDSHLGRSLGTYGRGSRCGPALQLRWK